MVMWAELGKLEQSVGAQNVDMMSWLATIIFVRAFSLSKRQEDSSMLSSQ
jgi:hypothetical protein